MAQYTFNLEPRKVDKIITSHRRIVTKIPPHKTLEVFLKSKKYEPSAMLNELPVLWDHAEGYQIFDSSGNCWIDFSSGIFVTNVGHSHPDIRKAIMSIINQPLLHNYYFLSEIRAKLVRKIVEMSPPYLDTVFLLTTGTETTECAMKITRIYGKKINEKKIGIISFDESMHGKTLGALMLGGKIKEKHWIGKHDPNIHHIPFPFPYTCPWRENDLHECNESCFHKSIKLLQENIDLSTIAGFMIESYQGWGALFYPVSYLKALEKWADDNNVLIIFDEIQSGFGRTGKLFAFEHYGIQPDIVCCGKGISSSLPLSAVLSRRELLDADPSLNSTHGGNPICCAATLASIEVIEKEDLVNQSARKGLILQKELEKIKLKHKKIIRNVSGKGLIFALHFVKPQTNELDVVLADRIIEKCMEKGLLMIRTGTGTIKIGPPLMIPDEALLEGIQVLDESITKICS